MDIWGQNILGKQSAKALRCWGMLGGSKEKYGGKCGWDGVSQKESGKV